MFEEILEKLSEIDSGQIIEDVQVKKDLFPAIFLHQAGMFIFLEDGNIKENYKKITDKIYNLQMVLSLDRGKMWIYSCDENENWTWLNPYNNDVEDVNDLYQHVISFIRSGTYNFEEARLNYFADKLAFGVKNGAENVMTGSDGESYVRHNGKWYPASDEDSDEVFMKTCMFGVFGWFQFHTKHYISGLLYLLSCGFFGIGWIFDILHFLIGYAKDADKEYYLPISDKKKGWISLLVCIAAAVVLVMIYMKAFGLFNNGFSKVFTDLATSGDTGAVESFVK